MKANLFIVGAPKCGTTALAAWLSGHPQVFVSPRKEPHHFSAEYQLLSSRAEYEALFAGATKAHQWRCEASVWYLFSPHAVREALAYNPDARFIAMVRNPMEMIPSMHRQQRVNGNDLVSDLSDALELNDRRLAGESVGVATGYPSDHLAYLHSCALGWQIERLARLVPAEQLHIVCYDDLRRDADAMYRGVLRFLDVEAVIPTEFQRINAAHVRRSWWLDRLVRNVGRWKSRHAIPVRFGVLSTLRRWNRVEQSLPPLARATRGRIISACAADVRLLEEALHRDLSHWFAD